MNVRARIAVLKFVRLGLLALALMVTGGSILASPRDDGSASANPDRGLYVFQAYCVGCHGETGNGDGPVAAKLFRDFGVRPTDLSSAWFQESNTDLDLQRIIKGGSKAGHRTDFMPAWGGALTDRQVEDLVAYLRELTPKAGEVAAAMISVSDELELGRVLYTVRCLACHGPQGRGDGPFLEGLTMGGSTLVRLPDFSDYEFLRPRSDQSFIEVLAHGLGHSGLLPEGEQGWWDRKLDSDEMQALVFYIRALPLQPSRRKT